MTVATTKPLLFMALAIAVPAAAEDDVARPQAYQDLVKCRAIAEMALRLACFDAASAKLEQAAEAKDIVILDRAEVKKTRRSLFGFLLPKLPFFDDRDEEKFTAIETTLASVSDIGYGKWQFEIPDGGVWQTTESTKSILRVGRKVRIKQGAVGGFLMQIGNGGHIRVRRIS